MIKMNNNNDHEIDIILLKALMYGGIVCIICYTAWKIANLIWG